MAVAEDNTLLDVVEGLNIYYAMFLIIFGTVCNVLSIIILSREAYKGGTFSIYFRFLASVDLFTLYSGLIRHFIKATFDYSIRDISETFCKIHQWTTATSPDVSAWVLVAVTTERVVSIIRPFKVHVYFSQRNVGLFLFILTSSLLTFNIPLALNHGDLVITEKDNSTTVKKCAMNRPDMDYFMDNIWYWIDLTKFVLLPSYILAILNGIIIYSVAMSRKRVERFLAIPSSSQVSHDQTACRLTVPQKEISLTVTLLVVNVTFVILNSPISIYLIGRDFWFEPGFKPTEKLVYTCSIMAMYTNNASNFLLYCATGSKFRNEIAELLRCHTLKGRSGSRTYSTSSSQKTRPAIASVTETV